jgi:hypothetical protein
METNIVLIEIAASKSCIILWPLEYLVYHWGAACHCSAAYLSKIELDFAVSYFSKRRKKKEAWL